MAPELPVDYESFVDHLLDHEIKSKFIKSSKEFWSNEAIEFLLREDIVRALLNKPNVSYEDNLVDFILNDAKKLFAITASLDSDYKQLLKAMIFFHAHGFRDSCLSSETGEGGVLMENRHSLGEKLGELDQRLWRSALIRKFCETRWLVLVPVFSTSRGNYSFREDTILPFLEVIEKDESGKKKQRGGAFSTVHQVKIHEGYYSDSSGKERPKYFAVKEIRPPDEDERIRVDEVWLNEANMLRKMNEQNDGHILRFITAFTQGDDDSERAYYLMFEWADGGSLEDVWKQNQNPALNGDLVKESAEQLLGLARALETTHNVAKIRHGDLKPENVLRFQHTPDKIFGTLKIGDWGLAKYHANSTVRRKEKGEKTTTRYSTRLYEPPEVVLGDVKILGRQFDIWSIGCIILELIIWLLYGYDYVKRFRNDVQGQSVESVPCYEINSADNLIQARLRPVVVNWIEHISKDKACADYTALGELMTLIKTRLLVVELPKQGAQTQYIKEWDVPGLTPGIAFRAATTLSKDSSDISGAQRHRATSVELVKRLDPEENGILNDDERPVDYWFWEPSGHERKGPPEFNTRSLQDETGHLLPGHTLLEQQHLGVSEGSDLASGMNQLSIQNGKLMNYHPKLDDEWEIHLDNNFAGDLASRIRNSSILALPELKEPSELCSLCQSFDFFGPLGFSVEYNSSDLKEKAKHCDLCKLFWETGQRNGGSDSGFVLFQRVQSSLVMNGVGVPVLSICRNLDSKVRSNVQIGFPRLPEAGGLAHFEIMRQWLQLCDDKQKHPNYHTSSPQSKCMPTRLIDVGENGQHFIRVWEPGPDDTCQYIALSHPWGHGPHFVTDFNNLKKHKDGIFVGDLPATFRDAVSTTRALGKRYLWIDSICIIQGPGGDFEDQVKKMETVFSSAYCVVVASRAYSQIDGFLQPRRERDYVALREKIDVAPFYICENIDDFNSHVLNGHLNKRGWVLQEHALARRTIFFTEDQTYFECGDGVRCETLTKMSKAIKLLTSMERSNLAAFLGDPNFPRIIMSASQGEKIIRFQNLYKTYSGLAFTNVYDRPVAIDGIESRLLNAFGTPGGFGVFDEDTLPAPNAIQGQQSRGLLRRSLLWYRPPGKNNLSRIMFPSSRSTAVPSWSWMAYMGEIDFLKPGFGNVDWKYLRSPWSLGRSRTLRAVEDRIGGISLSGELSSISYDAQAKELGKLFFDRGEPDTTTAQCVVLGVEQRGLKADICYFILVAPASDRGSGENRVYERVGAGYLPGRCISSAKCEIEIV